MRRSIFTRAGLVVVAALALVACAGGDSDDSPDDVRADLSEELQASLGLGGEQADCFAEILVDEIGADELQDIDFTAQEPPPGMEQELTSAALEAVERCDIGAVASGG